MSARTTAAPSKPSIEASNAMTGGTRKAASFRADTVARAKAAKWNVEPKGTTTVFTRGKVRVTVTYSVQDYVRKAEGGLTILPGEKRKWIRLNAYLEAPAV